MKRTGLFTSESVSIGHPDRLCDTIVNTITTTILDQDPNARVGLEAMVTKNLLVLSGEVSFKGRPVPYESIARQVVAEIGYTEEQLGFDSSTFNFINMVNKQSPDIAQGVNQSEDDSVIGAGDQGIMFGYATSETDAYLPLTALIANALTFYYQEVRSMNPHILSPDAKSQVTYNYDRRVIDTIVIAASHKESVSDEVLQNLIMNDVILPVLSKVYGMEPEFVEAKLKNDGTRILINTTGRFVVCGPASDAGLVGRKLVVDSYGGAAPIGGGNTNGKDPSKVDTSAARAARHAALNIVAAGLCSECLIQLSYAIGKADPVSIRVEAQGLRDGITERDLEDWLTNNYDFSVAGIIRNLKLKRQDYSRVTLAGQFGANSAVFQNSEVYRVIPPSWETPNLVGKLRRDFNLCSEAAV